MFRDRELIFLRYIEEHLSSYLTLARWDELELFFSFFGVNGKFMRAFCICWTFKAERCLLSLYVMFYWRSWFQEIMGRLGSSLLPHEEEEEEEE